MKTKWYQDELRVFRTMIYEVARQIGAKVGAVYEPDGTPNFWAAELQGMHSRFYVLRSFDDHWAFSRFFEPRTCRLEFIDVPEAADVLRLFGKQPMSKSDLEVPLQSRLGMGRYEIKYWKPAIQGDILFNWWD